MSATYVSTLAITVVASVALCFGARRHPGTWVGITDRLLAVVLLAASLEWVWTTGVSQGWSPADSLPLALCDVATLVAAAALWWRIPLLVELTWFWGLAGSLQSLITPDVQLGLPSATFIEYVVAHAGIVITALFLVVGQRIAPRARGAARVFAITAAYTAVVGLADALTGGDYMYLRSRPSSWTLLSVLGPWPWYIFSAAGVALVLLVALDGPFWHRRQLSRRAVAP